MSRKWPYRILLIVCSYISVLSLAKIISLQGDANSYWGGSYFGYNITAVVLFGLTIWLLNRFLHRGGRRQVVTSAIGGLLLALAVVYGAYAHYVNDIFRSVGESLLQIGRVLGIAVLTIPLVSELLVLFEKWDIWYMQKRQEGEAVSRHHFLYFIIVWMIIFCSYLPLFLAWWPGNFVFDSAYQLRDVILDTHSTHHPLIHTLMMGKAYQLGQRVGDVSWGYQFYTLTQMLVLASSFAYLLLYLYKKHAPRCIRVGTLLWFALFPMHALFAISATKDVLCAAFFLYFMIFMVRLLCDREKFKWYSYAGMIASGVLLSLFRNNALYAVILSGVLIAIFIKGWKDKGKVLAMLLCILTLTQALNEGMISYTNAREPDTYREALCVPLQCMARVASYRRADLSQELYDEICMYIREDDISGYNPYLADAVKNDANETYLRSNTLNFMKLWAKIGLQFPDEYIESIVTNTMGYWYPLNQGTYVSADIALYHTLIGVGDEIEKHSYCKWAEAVYSSLFWTTDYHSVPVLGYAFRNAPYIWLVVFYMLWCLYKKDRRGAMVGLLPVFYLLSCFCGPMAALRYIYCIVVCTPLLLYLIVSHSFRNRG